MATTIDTFTDWLAQAGIVAARLTAQQEAVLQAAFRFRQSQGDRLLLHPPAQPLPPALRLRARSPPVARLLGDQPPHRFPPARALLQAGHPASPPSHGRPALRQTVAPLRRAHCSVPLPLIPTPPRRPLDFIDPTFGVRVSRVALHKFLKKYGLDQSGLPPARAGGGSDPGPGRRSRRPPQRRSPAAAPAACRRPPFLGTHALRRRVPVDGPGPRLVGRGPGASPTTTARLTARPVDQRLRPRRRPGTHLASRRHGRCRLRPVDRRPPLPVPACRRRLAAPSAVVRGRCLLPPHQPLALDPRRRRPGQLRRAHHPTLDPQVSHPQGLRHHAQQVHALREAVLQLRA